MKHKIILIALALYTIVSLAFAQVDQTGASTNDTTQARLRVSNCVYNGPNVDIYINGEIAEPGGVPETNLYFNTWGYNYLTPGTYTVTVTPTGKSIEEAMMETEVNVEAGHRYTVVMMGQPDEATHTPLIVDETKAYQDIGATPTDAVEFTVNNLRGVPGIDIAYEDGIKNKNVPYGGFQAAIWPSGLAEGFSITVSGTTDQHIDGPFDGPNYVPAGEDMLDCFGGIYSGTMAMGQDYDVHTSISTSSLNVVEYLQALSQQGQADSRLPTFEIFLQALEAAGLNETVTSNPHLLYVPTDAAFEALPNEQLDALMNDPKSMSDLLRYHIVEGYYPSGTLAYSNRPEVILTNLLGKELKLLEDQSINGVGDESIRPLGNFIVGNGSRVIPLSIVLMPPSQ